MLFGKHRRAARAAKHDAATISAWDDAAEWAESHHEALSHAVVVHAQPGQYVAECQERRCPFSYVSIIGA